MIFQIRFNDKIISFKFSRAEILKRYSLKINLQIELKRSLIFLFCSLFNDYAMEFWSVLLKTRTLYEGNTVNHMHFPFKLQVLVLIMLGKSLIQQKQRLLELSLKWF